MDYVLVRFTDMGDDVDAKAIHHGPKEQCEGLAEHFGSGLPAGVALRVMPEAEWRFVFRTSAEAVA